MKYYFHMIAILFVHLYFNKSIVKISFVLLSTSYISAVALLSRHQADTPHIIYTTSPGTELVQSGEI